VLIVNAVIIPPPTLSVNEGILFFNRSFFLYFFFSPPNLRIARLIGNLYSSEGRI